MPGDLGDARLNNLFLEHFFRWLTRLDPDYWNATFFYPYQKTIAFSDNLLGSAPFYAVFRLIGLDQVSAYQGWYILGYGFNFAAAAYVLGRLKLKPLAVGAGAFFFTFGLPLLAQENHAQLLYRFGIPLACYLLWRFYEAPRLRYLVGVGFWLVWQFYLTIYNGIFLLLLLAALVVLLSFCVPAQSIRQRLLLWPQRVKQAWLQAPIIGKMLALLAIVALGAAFAGLIRPYYWVSRVYGFSRSWDVVSTMLPNWRSYFLADRSLLWNSTSLFSGMPARHEQQLFPGIAVLALVVLGIAGRFKTKNHRLAWLHFLAAALLVVLTLEIRGASLYRFIWQIPGMNSLRAVTRVQLVVMWPLTLYTAWVIDGLLGQLRPRLRWMKVIAYLAAGLLLAESVFYNHLTYNKYDAQKRLVEIRQLIPASIPERPHPVPGQEKLRAFLGR